MIRECQEELGWVIQSGKKITEVGEYLSIPRQQTHYFIWGTYYFGTSYSKQQQPSEDDHHLEWVLPSTALPQIVPKAQQWVIQSYF